MRKLFLTGNIQVGKSTAINKALSLYGKKLKVGGFRTVKGSLKTEKGDYIHMISADGSEEESEDNRAFFRNRSFDRPRFEVLEDAFNVRGVGLLESGKSCDLILMDEIGTAEGKCQAFHDKLLEILNGELPVIGVVQIRQGGFLDEIRHHELVDIILVNENNRDLIPDIILKYMEENIINI